MSLRRFGLSSIAIAARISKAQPIRQLAIGRRKSVVRSLGKPRPSEVAVPPPANAADPWVEVFDKTSGQVYWWNQSTDETTALGAPKPAGNTAIGQPAQQQVAMQQPSTDGGLMGVVAQGMAFGVGSAIAHRAVGAVAGSLFGGGSDDTPISGGGDGGEWDI